MATVLGYNVKITLGGKTVLARTQEDLSISALTKESITKDDNGNKTRVISGHDVTFSISALMSLDGTTGSTTKLDRDEVIEMALKTGSEAELDLVYSVTGGASYSGKAVITGYSESSSADPDSDTTISLDLAITGAFTKVTQASS